MPEPFEEGEIPELFPGYEEEVRKRRLAITTTEQRISEVSTQVESVSKQLEAATQPRWWQAAVAGIFPMHAPLVLGLEMAARTKELSSQRNILIDELEALSDQQLRNLWQSSIYEGLPLKIQQGEVESFDDFLTHPAFQLPDMTPEERAGAEATFRSITGAFQRTELVGKEDANRDEIISAMAERYRPKVPLAGVHQLSVAEIVKGFKARYELAPPPLSLSEVNTIYREAGIPEELIKEAEDLKKMSADYDDYWAETLANQELVRAGLEEARMPEMTLKDQLLLAVQSPVLIALDTVQGFARQWWYPWAATLFRARIEFGRATHKKPLTKYEQNFMNIFEEAKQTDDWWHAGGKAWEEAEKGWANTLVYEILLDPLNLFGLGLYTQMAKRIPWAGRWLGPLMARTELGWVKMWDKLIFDQIKKGVHAIPKTPMQAARAVAGDDFGNVIRYLTVASGGKHYRYIPIEEARDLLIKARAYALKHPEDLGIKGAAGRAMLRAPAITESGVQEMLTKLGTKLEVPISRDMLTSVNLIFSEVAGHTTGRLLTTKTAPPFLLRALTAHETTESLKIAKSLMTTYYRNMTRSSSSILRDARTTGKLLADIFRNTQEITFKSSESLAAHNLEMTGKLAASLSKVGWTTMNIWRTTIDKWAITTFARMYLVFAAYGPFNAIEGVFKPVFARINPFWRKGVDPVTKGQTTWAGVLKPRELETAVPYIQISPEMPSIMDFERAGPALHKWRSFWSGYKLGDWMVDAWGRIGVKQRWNYWHKMATRYLAEEEAPDLMQALARNIDDFVKDVPDEMMKSLRLSRSELKSELLDRAIAGPESVRNMIDDAVTDRIAKTKVSPDKALEDRIAAGQIEELAANYTLVPDSIQENAVRRAADGRLWSKAGAGIDEFHEAARLTMYDNFLKSPELFESRYAELAKGLISYQPANKAEFLEKLKMLEDMVNFYSDSSSSIIRGAKEAADEMFIYAGDYDTLLKKQQYMDDIWAGHGKYMDSGGEQFETAVKGLRANIEGTQPAVIDWAAVTWDRRITPKLQSTIKGFIDDLPIDVKVTVREIRIDPKLPYEAEYSALHKRITFKGVKEAQSSAYLYHETGHGVFDDIIGNRPDLLEGYMRSFDIDTVAFGKLTETEKGGRLRILHEDFADDFVMFTHDPQAFKAKYSKRSEFFEINFAKRFKGIDLLPEQRDSILSLFDLWSDQVHLHRATRAAQREAESALLSATPPGKGRNDVFWQKFRSTQHEVWNKHDLAMAELKQPAYIQQARVSSILDDAGPPPPIVDASGRQLTKMDVTSIFHSHPQSSFNMVLTDGMTMKGKLRYVTEVRAQAEIMAKQAGRTADELGFTKPAIESVYDQTLGDMLIDPARASVLEPQLMELQSFRQELWNVYDTKGLPRGTVEAMNTKLASLTDNLAEVPGYRKPDVMELSDDFLASKQRAADRASQEYFKDWADYTNETALTALGRTIYPFWVYETHRLFWVPRNMIRFPGMYKAWGTYMNNTEDGYIHIPGTSLQVNPLRGTIWMGGAIRLIRQDYPEYYDLVPGLSETLDYASRFGFYPALWVNTLKTMAGAKSARGRMMLGELLPAYAKTPLNAYLAVHGDSAPAQALTQIIAPDIYREYVTMIFASRICQERGLDYSGRHIWDKVKEGLPLNDEEKDVWGQATKKYGLYGILLEQGGIFRVRANQMVDAWEESGKLIEEVSGLTQEQQLWIRRHGFRVADYSMLPPEHQDLLREMDSIKYWAGIYTVLFPSSWQEEDRKRSLFWSSIRDLDDIRLSEYEESDRRVRAGEVSFRQWLRKNSQIAGKFRDDFDAIANSEEYQNVPIGLFDELDDEGNVVRKGLATVMEERNQLPPMLHPAEEILNMYYGIELEEAFDPVSESWYQDWDSYFWKIDNIVEAVGEDRRPDLIQQITKNMTELKRLYWQVSREYFRPYNRVQTVQLELYDEEQKRQIRRFLTTPSDTERDALKEVLTPDGTKLISGYTAETRQARQNMRLLNPELDAWLLFFQITQKTMTDEAQRLYTEYRRKYGIAP